MADFKFNGFPENESFEIPDNHPSKNQNNANIPNFNDIKNMSEKDIQAAVNSLPPEMTNFMKSVGIDPNLLTQQLSNMVNNMSEDEFNSMMTSMLNDEECGDCSNCDSNSDISKNPFPTGEMKYLFPEDFGSVECEESESIYEEFVEKYGTDSVKYLDDNTGLRDFILNDLTSTLDFDAIKNMRFVNSNKYFILFYMEPKDPDMYGYFAAVIKRGTDNFAVYIPTYGNTFGITEDETSTYLYNADIDKHMFEGDISNIGSFKYLSADVIEFAIEYALAPRKKLLLSPREFGSIRSIRPSISGDSQFLPIGKITSNGSTKSVLLLKDAELPLDNESYNLFIKFPTVVDDSFLRFFSSILFQVDFNECLLMENVELKYTNDGKLYFDLEHLRNI